MSETQPNLDELMTVEQFAAWQNCKPRWVRSRLPILPGVIRESRQHVRIHPRTYLAKRLGKMFAASVAVLLLLGAGQGMAAVSQDQMIRALIGEAGGESLQTQTAVAEVIRERVATYGSLRGVYGLHNPVVDKASPATWAKARKAFAASATSHLVPAGTLYFGGDRLDDGYFKSYRRVAHYGRVSFYQPSKL